MSDTNSISFTPYPSTALPNSKTVPDGVYASPTLGKLFEALAKAQGEFDVAIFDAENPHFRNRFATLKAVDAATKKQLVKHGLAVTQLPYTGSDGAPHMLTVLGHSSGEYIGGDLKLILQKQDMQGLGSAVTYGKRYSKSAVLGVVSDEDDDGNAASATGERVHREPVLPTLKQGENFARKITADQQKKLRTMINEAEIPTDDVLNMLHDLGNGAKKLEEVPFVCMDALIKEIKNW